MAVAMGLSGGGSLDEPHIASLPMGEATMLELGADIGLDVVPFESTAAVAQIQEPLAPTSVPEYDTHPIVVDSGPVVPLARLTLAEYGPEMAAAEAKYGLPRGLVWAVAWRESTGGKFACGFNAWGWDSCKGETFDSWERGIETVARRLRELIDMFGLAGALSVWVSGNARDGQWYATEVIALLP